MINVLFLKYKNVLFFLFLILIVACSNPQKTNSDTTNKQDSLQKKEAELLKKFQIDETKIIPEAKFKQVLKEIHFFEAYRQNANAGKFDSIPLAASKLYYQEIFKKNGVSEEAYFNTFKYYEVEQIAALNEIYKSLESEIQDSIDQNKKSIQ